EVRFETPMAGVFGDHCVVRLFSPLRTAAGGILIVPVPFTSKLRKIPEEMRARLLEAPDAEPDARVLTQVEFAGAEGVNWEKLAALTCLEEKKLDKAVQSLARQRLIFCFHKDSRSYVSANALEFWKRRFMVRASEFHAQNPLLQGMARGWLLTGVASNLSQQMGLFVLSQLVKDGALVAEADLYRRADFTVQVFGSDEELAELILKAHRETPRTPPMMRHFLEAEKLTAKQVAPVIKMLLQKGELVKINDDLYYDASTLEDIKNAVRVWFDSNTDLTPVQFKDVAGLTRKHAMPLLEYFDNSHFTVRIGNERKLRRA
ncbi:MAG: SelB C-terminal domain-containing protein, partial [Clostridia bacterium]|nr:SelB C-terminal domain-containing protein [Clostridia bacterium]